MIVIQLLHSLINMEYSFNYFDAQSCLKVLNENIDGLLFYVFKDYYYFCVSHVDRCLSRFVMLKLYLKYCFCYTWMLKHKGTYEIISLKTLPTHGPMMLLFLENLGMPCFFMENYNKPQFLQISLFSHFSRALKTFCISLALFF